MAGDEERPATPQGEPPKVESGVALPAREPSLEAATDELAAADLSADRPAEAAAASAVPPNLGEAEPPPRRSLMPALLAVIGGVLIVLLAANLYGLYNPPANDAVPALQAEVTQLRQRVDGMPKQAPVDIGPLDARVSALDERLAGLKTSVDQNAGGAASAAEAKAAVQPLAARVNDLQGALEALAGRVAALPKVDLAPISARIDEADRRLQPLESYFNAPKTSEQVTEARQNGSAAEARAAPIAVISSGIVDALGAGQPFGPDTRALAGLGVGQAALAPLQAVSETGAATDSQLASGFAAVEDAVVVAAAPVSSGTMIDRMMANAQSLVKVSRTGAGSGEDAAAIASRIAASLKAGDLTAASSDWDKLPEASRARSADWAARLRARLAAEAAARALQRSAVEALAASVPAP